MKRALATWDPFDELENLRGLARVLTPRSGNGDHSLESSSWAPAVDIAEDDKEYVIKADLPEVDKEDVNVTFENGMLTLSGERHFEKSDEDDGKKYHRVERSYGHYSRSFRLPDLVDAESLTAEFRDGLQELLVLCRRGGKPFRLGCDLEEGGLAGVGHSHR